MAYHARCRGSFELAGIFSLVGSCWFVLSLYIKGVHLTQRTGEVCFLSEQ